MSECGNMHYMNGTQSSQRNVIVVEDDGNLIQKQIRLGQAHHDRRKSGKDSESEPPTLHLKQEGRSEKENTRIKLKTTAQYSCPNSSNKGAH